MFYLLLLTFISACSIIDTNYKKHAIPKDIAIHLETFQDEAVSRDKYYTLKRISFKFTPLDEKILGRCDIYNNRKEILLNTKHWSKLHYFEQEQLIFHELGHCVFGLDHDDRWIYEGDGSGTKKPASIMNQKAIRLNVYIKNRQYYIDQLLSIIGSQTYKRLTFQ